MNIYEQTGLTQKVVNMSSRQQLLFLLEKTKNEADWDLSDDSQCGEEKDNIQNGKDKEHVDFIIKNYNEEFENMRK